MISSHTPSPPGLARFLLAALVFGFGSLAAISFAYSFTNTTAERRSLSEENNALTPEPSTPIYHGKRGFEMNNISRSVPNSPSNFISGAVTLLETRVVDYSKSVTAPIDLTSVEPLGSVSVLPTDPPSLITTFQPGSADSEIAALVEKISDLLDGVDPLPTLTLDHLSRAVSSGLGEVADDDSTTMGASVTTLFPILPTPPTIAPSTAASGLPNSHPSLTGSVQTGGESVSGTPTTSGSTTAPEDCPATVTHTVFLNGPTSTVTVYPSCPKQPPCPTCPSPTCHCPNTATTPPPGGNDPQGPCPGSGYTCHDCPDGWFCPPPQTPAQSAPCGFGWPCANCDGGWFCVPHPTPNPDTCTGTESSKPASNNPSTTPSMTSSSKSTTTRPSSTQSARSSPAKPNPTNPVRASGWGYCGCWADQPGERALNMEPPLNLGTLTNKGCVQHCMGRGFVMAGTENGCDCYCGNFLNGTQKLDDSACSIPCTGDSKQACGGLNALSCFSSDDEAHGWASVGSQPLPATVEPPEVISMVVGGVAQSIVTQPVVVSHSAGTDMSQLISQYGHKTRQPEGQMPNGVRAGSTTQGSPTSPSNAGSNVPQGQSNASGPNSNGGSNTGPTSPGGNGGNTGSPSNNGAGTTVAARSNGPDSSPNGGSGGIPTPPTIGPGGTNSGMNPTPGSNGSPPSNGNGGPTPSHGSGNGGSGPVTSGGGSNPSASSPVNGGGNGPSPSAPSDGSGGSQPCVLGLDPDCIPVSNAGGHAQPSSGQGEGTGSPAPNSNPSNGNGSPSQTSPGSGQGTAASNPSGPQGQGPNGGAGTTTDALTTNPPSNGGNGSPGGQGQSTQSGPGGGNGNGTPSTPGPNPTSGPNASGTGPQTSSYTFASGVTPYGDDGSPLETTFESMIAWTEPDGQKGPTEMPEHVINSRMGPSHTSELKLEGPSTTVTGTPSAVDSRWQQIRPVIMCFPDRFLAMRILGNSQQDHMFSIHDGDIGLAHSNNTYHDDQARLGILSRLILPLHNASIQDNNLNNLSDYPPHGKQSSISQPTPWKPPLLRKPVLIAFIVLFGIIIAVLEVLLTTSEKHNGLTDSYAGLEYLWTYGPTAFLTLVQVLWNRVDYEIKITAPWFLASSAGKIHDAMLLDYIDMVPVAVIFRALRGQNYRVAASAIISLLLGILVVLSTSLFTLSTVTVTDESVPISLKTRFVDNFAGHVNGSWLPLYGVEGSANANLTDPEGIWNEFTYQSFAYDVPGISEIRATVDGVSFQFHCTQAIVRSIRPRFDFWPDDPIVKYLEALDFDLEYSGCNSTVSAPIPYGISNEITHASSNLSLLFEYPPIPATPHLNESFSASGNLSFPFLSSVNGTTRGQCGFEGPDYKGLVFLYATVYYEFTKATETTFKNDSRMMVGFEVIDVQSTCLVCTPGYNLTKVDVVRTPTGVKEVFVNGHNSSAKLPLHPWDIIRTWFDLPIYNSYYGLMVLHAQKEPSSRLSDATALERTLVSYFQKYAAFLFHQSFMEPTDTESTAIALSITNRLLVRPIGCHLMASIMSIIIIILFALLLKPWAELPYHMEPGSILATAIFGGHFASLHFPRNLGATRTRDLKASLNEWNSRKNEGYHNTATSGPVYSRPLDIETKSGQEGAYKSPRNIFPLVLRPVPRFTAYSLMVVCVVALEVLLQRSLLFQGLGDIYDETYLHYLWTILPATILSFFASFIVSVDVQTRLLTPYHQLTQLAPLGSSLELDLLRPLTPVALYRQLRMRNLAGFVTSIAALISTAFTISVGSLYQLEAHPVSYPVKLRTTSTLSAADQGFWESGGSPLWSLFLTNNSYLYPAFKASLILESNLSYTSLSYEDLVFPEVSLEYDTGNPSQVLNASAPVSATIPALRPGLSCRLYTDSEVTTTFFYNETVVDNGVNHISDGLLMNITGEACPWEQNWYFDEITGYPAHTSPSTICLPIELGTEGFIGRVVTIDDGDGSHGCGSLGFFWGRYSLLTDPPSAFMSALSCNYTLEALDVEVSFMGPQLQLDLSHPPRPIESTSRLATSHGESINYYLSGTLYRGLASLPLRNDDTRFDPFFDQLITSRYSIPLSAIGDPSQAEAVRDAIVIHHKVIVAQFISQIDRVDVKEPSGTANPIIPPLYNLSSTNDTGVYDGTASDPYGRRSVVQDPASTRVVQALLITTLVFSLLGWGFGPRKPVLPRSPTSIASVLALLAGGDVLEYMYRDGKAGWSTIEEVKSIFPENCKFRLGWGTIPKGAEGEVVPSFGIWVEKNKYEESLRPNDDVNRTEVSS
ncbi:hypothetical protein F5Y04DRAFT_278720 [Hypomontagnella monticulosa]|nr:hypothetical protein F5Y04DRAFT_278720 [Hypomontagnella monticulosa]